MNDKTASKEITRIRHETLDELMPLFDYNPMLPIVFAMDLLCGFLNSTTMGDGTKESMVVIETLNENFLKNYGYALIWMGKPDD